MLIIVNFLGGIQFKLFVGKLKAVTTPRRRQNEVKENVFFFFTKKKCSAEVTCGRRVT